MPTATTLGKTLFVCAILALTADLGAGVVCALNAPGEMQAFDGDFAHRYGSSISVDGDTLLVGAPGAPVWGTQSGAAYIYERTADGWQLLEQLIPDDGVPFDGFGAGVAVSGEYALIGAPGRDDAGEDSGTVYVFRRIAGDWRQIDRIDAPESITPEGFGAVLDLDGPQAVIGMQNAALAYYRVDQTWYLTAAMVPDAWPASADFATSIRLNGNLAIIGAPGDDAGALTDAGAAYVYEFTGSAWAFRAKLRAFFPDALDWFGAAVEIDQSIAVVGAPRDDAAGASDTREDSGAMFVFVRTGTNTWSPTYKYKAPDAAARDNFGLALAMTPEAIVVGAARDDTANPADRHDDAGAAYVYRRAIGNSALAHTKLLPHAPRAHAGLGRVVAAHDGYAFAGAPDDDALCPGQFLCHSGSISVLPGISDCNNNGRLDVCDIELNPALDADGDGIIDGCVLCHADATGDGVVNVSDLNLVLMNWGAFVNGPAEGDLSGDALVGVEDLNLVLMEWGGACL